MPIETRSRARTPFNPALDLPPGFRLVTLREAGDAFDHATRIAAKEGAGTLVWARRFDLVEFAVVLEPEEPLAAARRAFYAGQAALADALAVHAPPETLINFEWPDAIFVQGALVGGGRLGWPKGADEKAPPPWLVFGAMVRTAIMEAGEPGLRPHATALEDEGFDDLGPGRLVESFARHLMVTIDAWQDQGFRTVAESYLARLLADEPVERSIDGVGDLLTRRKGKPAVEKRQLVPALKKLAWFDPESKVPLL
jgi:biotin-(acetyl-CoA carboxylase) ligase